MLNVINPVVSLSCTTEDGDETIDIPVDDTDKLFDRLSVHQAIRDLSNDELLLIKYRFYEGKTQCESAKLLGISQVQVSRREKQLLAKLRTRLE